jgi:DNA-binding GntR family transcriptional regulator
VAEDPRLYVRVLLSVREQIDDGTLRAGERTPTIGALCWQFGCTRQTVSKALRLLADEGLLIRYPGLGYYVAAGDGLGSGRRPRGSYPDLW